MKVCSLIVAVSLLSAFGCSKDSAVTAKPEAGKPGAAASTGIVGKWKVDPDFQKEHAGMKPEGFMTGFSSTFWYDLKADKTFSGSMSEGTYSVSGDKLTITTTKLMGQEVAKMPGNNGKAVEMMGQISADGKSIVLTPPNNGMLPAELAGGIKMAKEGG